METLILRAARAVPKHALAENVFRFEDDTRNGCGHDELRPGPNDGHDANGKSPRKAICSL
jgi:hypothetical protein